MAWPDDRMGKGEDSIEVILRTLRDLADKIKALQQALRALDQRLPGPQPSIGGAYVCMCPAAVPGTWSGAAPTAPGTFQAEVYLVGGDTATDVGLRNVSNWMPAPTVAGRACLLIADGQGGYVVVSQSCG